MARGACPLAPTRVQSFLLRHGFEVTGSRGDHAILSHVESGRRVQLPRGGKWRDKTPWFVIDRIARELGVSPGAVVDLVRGATKRRRDEKR
jgi:hypothetical protein